MSQDINGLQNTVKAMRPFVPARDFEMSKRFYSDIGFEGTMLGGKLASMRLGAYSFLLQDYYVEQWAANFMMHLLVTDVNFWWNRISSLNLSSRPRAPKLESWGLMVAYLFDPSGVLWHIAQESSC